MILIDRRLNQLKELGCELSERQREQIEIYMSELALYNPRLSLVNYTDEKDLFQNHILDCLAPVAYFREIETTNWADVGSGAGLPGILLAIALPEKNFTLIERQKRRSNFLESVAIRLGLKNVRVLSIDLERTTERFDAVVFRAFRPLLDFASLLKGILEEGGTLFAYKGRLDVSEQERKAVAPKFTKTSIKILETPSQKERCLLVLTK